MNTKSYYPFSSYLKERFGVKVHRIGLNAGFSCPNRDGSLSDRGCIFCNEEGFSHFAKTSLSIEEQIESSIDFTRERFKAEKFIAYFQNASNTYASPEKLKKTYDVIKKFPDIVGLFISTRPDCIDGEKLDLIASYRDKYETWIEYGMQTIHDATLKNIERAHDHAKSAQAIIDTDKKGIKAGVHVVLGLPGETKEDMIKTAEAVSVLPISGVKLHALHVLRDTKLEQLYNEGKIKLLSREEYIDSCCDFLERIKPECVIFRLVSDAKKDVLVAPEWINEKQKVIEGIKSEFEKRKTCQGNRYKIKEGIRIH